jgi:plastocyanin
MLISRTIAAVFALALPALAGDVSGTLLITKRLTKKAPPQAIYDLRGTSSPLVNNASEPVNEFDRMVVILEGGKLPPRAVQTAVIEQRNSRFEPDLVVVPVGSTVQFPNGDPIFHNVFSLSRAQSFDLGFFPKGQSREIKFNREGIVQVYCHIHASMYAAIVVTASPWYGKPSSDGTFSFHNIPAGHYRVIAWHKIAGAFHGEVDVPDSGKAEVIIHVPVDTGTHP